jgi:hypothetical protein
MRRRAAPVRWRQYFCRAGSTHNSVEAASIATAITIASIGPSRSRKQLWCIATVVVPAKRDRVVEIEQIARGNFIYPS